MKLLSLPYLTPKSACPYLEGQEQTLSVFWARDISPSELDDLLSTGWRKFGEMNFKPSCDLCQKCTPLRIVIDNFSLSKSQRRVLNKNLQVVTDFLETPLYKKEYFQLYIKHSKAKFNKETIESEIEFIASFFSTSKTLIVSEFKIQNQIIAYGILENSILGLSSVYFVYDPDFSHLSLGTYGALKEIEYAKGKNLTFYYLGYWIQENKSLSYKDKFKPSEKYDWNTKTWK